MDGYSAYGLLNTEKKEKFRKNLAYQTEIRAKEFDASAIRPKSPEFGSPNFT